MGCVHLYCGDGKRKDDGGDRFGGPGGRNGKTGSCCPLFKTDQSGEVEILKLAPGGDVDSCEKHLFLQWKNDR